MQIAHIIMQAKRYVLMGGINALLALVVFLLGYYIVYRKIMKGTGRVSKRKFIMGAIFICYLTVVIGATLLERGGHYEQNLNLRLFSSYKEAWNSFSSVEWRNIILNILLFVPMGMLLPVLFRKMNAWWKVYTTGFLVSFLIELVQLVGKLGISEADDLLNNTVGTMIGYGMFAFLFWMLGKRQEKETRNGGRMLLLQLPLLVTILGFTTIFTVYHFQEFGNLKADDYQMVSMKNKSVTLNITPSKDTEALDVYQAKKAGEDEIVSYANELLKHYNTTVDESQNDAYQDTLVCRSMDGNYSVWVDYKGMTTWFIDFEYVSENAYGNHSEEDVRNILLQAGIELPEQAEFEREDSGNYLFYVNMLETLNGMLDGQISCAITKEGNLMEYQNDIISYQKVRKVDVISEQEAIEQFTLGRFNKAYLPKKFETVVIEKAELVYQMDSKGYYQPVYQILAKLDGEDNIFYIPARK